MSSGSAAKTIRTAWTTRRGRRRADNRGFECDTWRHCSEHRAECFFRRVLISEDNQPVHIAVVKASADRSHQTRGDSPLARQIQSNFVLYGSIVSCAYFGAVRFLANDFTHGIVAPRAAVAYKGVAVVASARIEPRAYC